MEFNKKKWMSLALLKMGWVGMGGLAISTAIGSASLASASAAALASWGIAWIIPSSARFMKKIAKGTRSARQGELDRIAKGLIAAAGGLSCEELARKARADIGLQRNLWCRSCVVMWMAAHPGEEHLHEGALGPGFAEDCLAWLQESTEALEEAAHRGWLCPDLRMADLMADKDMRESRLEIGAAHPGLEALGPHWPAKVRYCDNIFSLGHHLFDSGFTEQLGWRSQGSLEKLMIVDGVESLSSPKPSGRKLRL